MHTYAARRIALIKPSALGDIVHSLPVLTALRQRYPQAYIAWVINRGYEPLIRGHPDLDATIPFDRRASRTGWLGPARNYWRFLRDFRRQAFDLVVDLQGLLRSGLIAYASGAGRRVGLSAAREGARCFYTDVIAVADFNAIHAVDRYWLVAEAFGVGRHAKEFRLPPHEEERQWAQTVLAACTRPWLMVAPGSRWMTKRWPPEHFAELARRAQALAGGTILFLGGGQDRPLAQAVGSRLHGPWHDFTGQTTLPQLSALLAHADLVVGNDSGPLHLARALGRPVVAPYTCTKVLLNGPYGFEHGAVESRVWCRGSYLTRCSRLECMAELTPDRLWPIVAQLLRTWQNNSLSA